MELQQVQVVVYLTHFITLKCEILLYFPEHIMYTGEEIRDDAIVTFPVECK